ncbi:Unc104-like kinesin [Angomonas deanei]|uniref:Integral peroxisomal membrane peroxin, putative n=1 Tax=Angomonas deanei TaxID=59799 RepID=A0A7G2C6P9_9TRYP|nr:Unc104-like kinesin [Angomonas deanei]CAD2214764.1 Integral peroxisomal membrane peroxin, putative [Angomonas deanei]|eukprot:EPY26308.1 Unc104-like kinesin [Angomonas deanei]
MKPRQRDAVDDVDFDSSVSSGSALRGESSQVVQSTAPLSIVSQSQANINPDEIELEDINFDDLSVDSGLELDSASDGEQLEFDEDILLDENSRHSSGTPLEVDEDLLLESEEDVAEPNVAEEESAPAERPPEPPTMLSEKVLGKASLTKEMSQLDDFSHPSGKRPEIFQPSKSAPTVVIPSHALPHNFCLRESFKVVKMKDAVVGAKKDRIWEVDVLRKKFCNYDMHGKKTFEQLATNLYRVEKGDGNSKRLTLYFFDAPHPYEFEFASSARRQLFYELAMLLRRNSILWCPSLCVGGENDAIINIKGTTIDRVTGPPVRVDGECQFSVGRMPYEVINFWYGCFSLDGKDLPRNDAVLGSFIPKESHEIYIIGVTDIPSHLVGSDEIGRYFLAYIGSASYFVLESTAVKAKKKSVNNAIVIICRRSFIVRVCHVEAAELSPVYKDNMARSDFTAVGCALHINEASIGVVLVNFKRNKCTVETRTACLRTLLSAFPFGPLSVDIHVRFDYLIVSGSFGFDGSFSEQDVLQYQMSTDNLMSDMSEGVPSTPLKTAENPMRIFVRTNPKVCRFDVQQYSTSRALSSSNAYIIGDVFCRRTFLSTFGESAPPVQLILNEFQLSGDRYPYVSNPTLYLYGDWFENSPLTFQLVPRKQNVFQVAPNCEPILYPCVCSREFLRVQTLTFSIFGQVGTRQGGSPTLIGSGALPLKGTTVLGESAPFQVPFYFHGCRVGKVNGTVLTVLYEKNVLGGEGYSNERFLASASVYENQVRKTNRWEAANFSRDGIYEWSSLNTTTECVRDAFLLPSASWSWLSEWKLDLNHTSEGWLYGTLASENYSLRESSNASFRRRKWYRVMRADNPLALHEYLLHKSEQAKEASQ